MTEVVNLNKARKRRDQAAARKKADANAIKFGRTKAQKDADRAMTDKERRELDGKKRE